MRARVLSGEILLSLLILISVATSQTPATSSKTPRVSEHQNAPARKAYPQDLIDSGNSLFQQNCAFCHGRDATGGESGPDLTHSRLVGEDVNGNKIGLVVRNGRPDKGMPHFDLSDLQISSLV